MKSDVDGMRRGHTDRYYMTGKDVAKMSYSLSFFKQSRELHYMEDLVNDYVLPIILEFDGKEVVDESVPVDVCEDEQEETLVHVMVELGPLDVVADEETDEFEQTPVRVADDAKKTTSCARP